MDLVLFTSQYPFDGGEAFVEDEINILASYFDKVTIISYAKSRKVVRLVPANAKVIRSRDKKTFLIRLISFIQLFSPSTFSELSFMIHNLHFGLSLRRLHLIYMYYTECNIIKRLLRNNLSENTVYYSYWFGSRAYALSEIKRKHNIYYICRAHRVDCVPTNYNPFRREILSTIDTIFPISEKAKSEILETARLSEITSLPQLIVSRLGITKKDNFCNTITFPHLFRIVSCSSIIPRKRIDIIIQAISYLEYDGQIEWIHFGDGKNRNEIEQFACSLLNNKKNCSFIFKGNTHKDIILNYYKDNQVNLFINSSDSEGIPVSIMEALSYGIPCICRSIGGNAEIVQNNYNGYLVNTADPKYFASIINTFIKMSPENVLSIRKNAFQSYLELYNAKDNYNSLGSYLINHFAFFNKP